LGGVSSAAKPACEGDWYFSQPDRRDREQPSPDADTALRLGLYFRNSPEFWLNLQTHYDLKMARKNLRPDAIRRIKVQRAA